MATTNLAGRDGIRLAADHGEGTRPNPVVLLHGGGQTRHSWGDTADTLGARGWETFALDLRGHGDSAWDAGADYAPDSFGADVAAVARSLPAPPVLVGASLGGMSSLLALADGARAAALVLVDVAHRFEPAGAGRIVDFMASRPDGFASPAEATAAVTAYLPDRPRPVSTAGIAKNLRRDGDVWRWHWDPALLAGRGTFFDGDRAKRMNERLAATVAALTIPTLLVRGARSDVVSAEIAAEFAGLNPSAEVVDVSRAGHMVAGDSNDLFSAAVVDFLERRVA
jgi:pimeloyl-ACP methyl ester carboxylesterase